MYVFLGYDIWIQLFRYNYLKIWNLRVQTNLNIEKIAFKVVQIKFLAMHITNQKWSFYIFTVIHLLNIFMEQDILIEFWLKKINNFDPYNVFLAIATNIPQRLKTFLVQGHIWLLIASEIEVNVERSVSVITAVGTRGHAAVSRTSHQD